MIIPALPITGNFEIILCAVILVILMLAVVVITTELIHKQKKKYLPVCGNGNWPKVNGYTQHAS